MTDVGISAFCEPQHPFRPAPFLAVVEREQSGTAMLPGAAPGSGRTSASSKAELDTQIAALSMMDHAELRAEWRRLYRAHPPKKVRRDVLELGVGFKLQERVLGGLGASARRRVAELTGTVEAKGELAKARTIRPRPGAKLMREWGGITHEITVLEDGFSWQGKSWRSLSAIAQAITGAHWSGPRFFGLQTKGKRLGTAGQESTDA